ncbi:secretagogin-like isoform X1 [Diadema antillarum]|uniref:secretagogin-like isoform X1 n=2 Tax=Diadema antillarum TaxID=105358 RepID=UPI003A867FAA
MACKAAKLRSYSDLLSQDQPLTADDFAGVWEHFDSDGNGYIEGKELTNFFKELLGTKIDAQKYSETMFDKLVHDMMEDYDENKDGRIEMRELAELLQPEENFLVLFRSQQPRSSVEFMEIWRKFDADNSGYIEAGELRNFIKTLIIQGKESGDIPAENMVTPEKLEEYTQTILKLFDANNDGKLELTEMAKLLPTKENFLKQFEIITGKPDATWKGISGHRTITRAEFERIFSYYDKDNNGTIEGDELQGFLKDMCEHEGQEEVNMSDLEKCCNSLMKVCDQNKDGVIQKSELEMFFKPSDNDQEPQE